MTATKTARPPPDSCEDGIDNDDDGVTDEDDPECQDGGDGDEDGTPAARLVQRRRRQRRRRHHRRRRLRVHRIPNDGVEDGSDTPAPTQACVAEEDAGLLTDDTLGQTLYDGGLNVSPLFEDPEHNGAISGPLNDALDETPIEVIGDEATCVVDLLIDETVFPFDL